MITIPIILFLVTMVLPIAITIIISNLYYKEKIDASTKELTKTIYNYKNDVKTLKHNCELTVTKINDELLNTQRINNNLTYRLSETEAELFKAKSMLSKTESDLSRMTQLVRALVKKLKVNN